HGGLHGGQPHAVQLPKGPYARAARRVCGRLRGDEQMHALRQVPARLPARNQYARSGDAHQTYIGGLLSMGFDAPVCLPVMIGAAVMFAVLAWEWGRWLYLLPRADKMRILRGLPTTATLAAGWEAVRESLLHRRIFKVNPLLG